MLKGKSAVVTGSTSGIGLAIAAEAAARLSMRLEFSRPPDGGLQVVVRPALPVPSVS